MSKLSEIPHGTKHALIGAASRLFAEKGFEGASLREITGLAEVNLASVKYHFGSREGLIDAVVTHLVTPVNKERLRRLDLLEGQGGASVRELLQALFEPLLMQMTTTPLSEQLFCKLMGRVVGERPYEFPDAVMGQFREVAGGFVAALMKALPGMSAEDTLWQLHFSFGALSSTLMHGELLRGISAGMIPDEKLETTFSRVIDFCEAGFKQ